MHTKTVFYSGQSGAWQGGFYQNGAPNAGEPDYGRWGIAVSFLALYLLTLPTLTFLESTQDANVVVGFGCRSSMFSAILPFRMNQEARKLKGHLFFLT